MNINKVNLNLLKVFHVLMQEQHISRAANKLFLTQPAVSSSLQQLRELFQDELLVRTPKRMVPTKKALMLAPRISQIMQEVEAILFYKDKFDHYNSDRTFTLGMTDYSEFILLPPLYKYLQEHAPKINLKIVACWEFTPEKFENLQLDLGIGIFKGNSKQTLHEPLFNDRAVCVARKDNPIFAKPLTLENYLKADHLAILIQSTTQALTDAALQELNQERNIKITFSTIMPALETLSNSNLIATLPRNIVTTMAKTYPLNYVSLPFKPAEVTLSLIWQKQHDCDTGLTWLRTQIKKISQPYIASL